MYRVTIYDFKEDSETQANFDVALDTFQMERPVLTEGKFGVTIYEEYDSSESRYYKYEIVAHIEITEVKDDDDDTTEEPADDGLTIAIDALKVAQDYAALTFRHVDQLNRDELIVALTNEIGARLKNELDMIALAHAMSQVDFSQIGSVIKGIVNRPLDRPPTRQFVPASDDLQTRLSGGTPDWPGTYPDDRDESAKGDDAKS